MSENILPIDDRARDEVDCAIRGAVDENRRLQSDTLVGFWELEADEGEDVGGGRGGVFEDCFLRQDTRWHVFGVVSQCGWRCGSGHRTSV